MRKRETSVSVTRARSYLSELREHRESGFARMLASGGNTQDALEEKLGRDNLKEWKKNYSTEAMLIQNQTRGKLGELWGEILLTSQLQAHEIDLQTDTATFWTPFGQRRIDVFWLGQRLAVEAKSGMVCYSKGIRNQVAKDEYLLQQGVVSGVIWILLQGASRPAREALRRAGVTVVDGYEGQLPPELVTTIGQIDGLSS